MTDQDENRPLSRRELRLREMAAAGVAAVEPSPAPPAETSAGTPGSAGSSAEIDIPLFDENGRQRSRRELRELRERAIAELSAEAAAAGSETSPDTGAEQLDETLSELGLSDAVVLEESAADEHVAAAVPADASDFDALLREATAQEAAALEEAERESGAEETLDDAVAEVDPASATAPGLDDHEVEPDAAVDAAPAVEDESGPDPEGESTAATGDDLAESEVAGEEAVAAAEVEPDAGGGTELVVEATDELVTDAVSEVDVAADAGPVSADSASIEPEEEVEADPEALAAPVAASTGQSYSFPDIAPLDEGQSIFDDPALRVMGAAAAAQPDPEAAGGGDFDDLITRAVAQEGATSTTNTSALILPTMPESDALSGPLGETGELYITGSFDLPKSLSETGGHASLHDSIDAEHFDELGFTDAAPTGMMAPVSASRAVSARGTQGAIVSEASKDKSKLPVVLIATGGVLVLGATGLIVWAAASGLFG